MADPGDLDYVGSASCAECHETETTAWRGSHHDLAMQEVSAETVLGDFADATFTHVGVTSTFTRDGERFVVTTEDADGETRPFEIAYVFGVTPLQQYLVAFPGGRYQVLPLCWDTRPAEAGGQRWFHIYGDERIAPDDELFWTRRAQTWNYMCADCHSTNLRRNYDVAKGAYRTTWTDIDVGCEACHGPGSRHLAWAEAYTPPKDEDEAFTEEQGDRGLVLHPGRKRDWVIDPDTGSARPLPGEDPGLRACAPCHSRRGPLRDGPLATGSFHDAYRLSGLEEHLYFPDGQIKEEVYVYGSFLQSRMHAVGVTCTDCHHPHSLRLRAAGNAVCTRCHLPEKFDAPEHHHHENGTDGASCVACHMPERTYMVVDPRRDHSIRVPRPDLTLSLGVPNACTPCHEDKGDAWAANEVASWYPEGSGPPPHFGEDLAAGRTHAPARLFAIVGDPERPAMARAAALDELQRIPGAKAQRALEEALGDADPMVRAAGLRGLAAYPPDRRGAAVAALTDAVLHVRVEAARTLAAWPVDRFDTTTRASFARAFEELVASELAAAEQPSAHLNLGLAYLDRGLPAEAEAAYRTALRIDPTFTQATVNLADLLRATGRDRESAAVLRKAVETWPDDAALRHGYGLALVRMRRHADAVPQLAKAWELAPADARFGYVYAVALQSSDPAAAVAVLEDVADRHPHDPQILGALATAYRDAGELDRAIAHAERLVELLPDDPGARRLLDDLTKRQDR